MVSIVVSSKNEAGCIRACLESLLAQDADCEVILVDNRSTDGTIEIAEELGVRVELKGPERSTQRNHGAALSAGEYLCFIDADMVAPAAMARECLELMEEAAIGAVVIPEKSIGQGFWSNCKVLERDCYPPGAYVEAARFYRRTVFEALGGFDEELTGLEDLDLHQRCKISFQVAHSSSPIRHDEGRISFIGQIRKKYYYGRNSWTYALKHPRAMRQQANPLRGYFLRSYRKLLRTPVRCAGMLILKAAELSAGGIGIAVAFVSQRRIQ